MTQAPLPGIAVPSRLTTPAEARRECQRIIDILERQQSDRQARGGRY